LARFAEASISNQELVMFFTKKLTENYAMEISLFQKVRASSDGIDFIHLECSLDLFDGDHKPSFRFALEVCNFDIFDFSIYNMNHRS
jgi:hypothetical protein